MNKSESLFSLDEIVQFQVRLKGHLIAAAKSPLIAVMIGLLVLALGTVAYIEWEIVFRVFDYLSGDNEYWSPWLMGLTAAIMIIGFHLQAKTHPQNFAVRFVNVAVQFLIPVYLCGIGLFIACQLLGDGLGDMLGSEVPMIIGALPTPIDESWIEILFSKITNPLAVIAFAFGIGGLAIVNIYVAHQLLKMLGSNLDDLFGRVSRARDAVQDYAIILRTQKCYSELGCDLADLDIWDDNYIRLFIASDALSVIADALLPHKKWLKELELNTRSPFEPQEKADPKAIESAIKKIEAIQQKDILRHLTPQLLESAK